MTTEVPDADDLPVQESADQAVAQARMRNAMLAGATEGVTFPDGPPLKVAVLAIMSCPAHGGAHHFAVTGEGKTLWASRSAFECINAADLGFTVPGYAVPEKVRPKPFHDPSASSPRDRCEHCGGPEVAPYKYAHTDDCPDK